MKIHSFLAHFAIFQVAAPGLVAAVNGGLKGSSRSLAQTFAESDAGRQGALPSLEELDALYGNFCNICDLLDSIPIGDLLPELGLDTQYCDICDIEIPEIPEIPDLDEITCFSEISTVQVEGLGPVAMKDLELGFRVLTQSGTYEPVYAFGHKNPTKSAEFLQFQTAESSLEMTGGHLVFLEDKTNPVRADSIRVGDVLQGGQVTKISTVHRDGVYSPLTPSGTVVVDGIAASSYISLQKNANEFVELQGGVSTFLSFQDFLHMTLSPFRMLCMGVSSRLGNTYTEDGIPLYASYGMKFAKWAEKQNILVQLVLFLAVGALAGTSLFVENTFGASTGPLVLLAGAGAYAMLKKRGANVNFGFSSNKVKSV